MYSSRPGILTTPPLGSSAHVSPLVADPSPPPVASVGLSPESLLPPPGAPSTPGVLRYLAAFVSTQPRHLRYLAPPPSIPARIGSGNQCKRAHTYIGRGARAGNRPISFLLHGLSPSHLDVERIHPSLPSFPSLSPSSAPTLPTALAPLLWRFLGAICFTVPPLSAPPATAAGRTRSRVLGIGGGAHGDRWGRRCGLGRPQGGHYRSH